MRFKTQKEIFKHLVNGGAVINTINGDILQFENGHITGPYIFNDPEIWKKIDVPLKAEFECEWEGGTGDPYHPVGENLLRILSKFKNKKTKVTIVEIL